MDLINLTASELYEAIESSVKNILSEIAYKKRKYQTTLVMYSWYGGHIHENMRNNDGMDNLIRQYNNIKKRYEKSGCKIFKISFRGHRFLTIVDTDKRIISFVTILQNEESKGLVIRREDIPELSELLVYYKINPHLFGLRKPKQEHIPVRVGNPLTPEETKEFRHGQMFTNWDMMDRTPKKWRKVRDNWEYTG